MIRPLFKKYQRELVAFANTSYGRDFISQFGVKYKNPIVKITPDGIHEQLDKNTFRATFHSRSPYVKHFADVLTAVDCLHADMPEVLRSITPKERPFVIPHFMGETKQLENKLPLIYLASPATFNPDAHPESTSVDGEINRITDSDFATIRSGAGTSVDDTRTTTYAQLSCSGSPNVYTSNSRGVSLFDTSSLGITVIITAATFSGYGNSIGDYLSQGFGIVSSNPTSNTGLATGDYAIAKFGSTRYANDIALSAWNASGYNDWTFNADGIASISKTGISKYGHLLSCDIDNSAPTWSGSVSASIVFRSSDYGSNKPKLVVTYTVPSAGFFAML